MDSEEVAPLGCLGTLHDSIVLTTAFLFEGEKIIRSPTLSLPDSTRPAMILRSSNLYTSCTGKRKGR